MSAPASTAELTDAVALLLRLIKQRPASDDSLLPVPPDTAQQPVLQPVQQSITGEASALTQTHTQRHSTGVPVVHALALPYHAFVDRFMAANQPVLIRGACDGWPAAEQWVTAGGGVDIDRLAAAAGDSTVSVTDTARSHAGRGPCQTMKLSQYAAWWQDHTQRRQQQQQQPAAAGAVNGDTDCVTDNVSDRLLYLKDWHLAAELNKQMYSVPPYFSEDWLNEYYDDKWARRQCQKQQQEQQQEPQPGALAAEAAAGGGGGGNAGCLSSSQQAADAAASSDYRFLYVGPSGSWTPLHSDVLRSYSWSTNVVGRKRWRLLPPAYTHLLADAWGSLPPELPVTSLTPSGVESKTDREQQAAVHVLEVVQEEREALFVPSGWHHTVVNEADTLSINHNWLNAHNVHRSWALLAAEHAAATAALEDCRDTADAAEFEGLVQRLLLTNSGFNFEGFADLLVTVIGRRCNDLLQMREQQQQQEQSQQQQQLLLLLLLRQLHVALDLSRAGTVLEAVCAAAHDAAAKNAAWCASHGQQCSTSPQVPSWTAAAQEAVTAASGGVEAVLAQQHAKLAMNDDRPAAAV